MQPNLLFIDTHTGRIHVGATVRHTQRDTQGTVTEIRHVAGGYRLEVNGRYSDAADLYELLAGPDPVAQAIVDQAAQGVTSGAFEVRIPREHDRIFFAETPAQVVALLARLVGILPERQPVEAERIVRAVHAGRCDELAFRGSFGIVGQLAYVSIGQHHPQPKFKLGDQVVFHGPGPARTVSSILLCKPAYGPNAGRPTWHYSYAEAPHHPMPETSTSAAPSQGAT